MARTLPSRHQTEYLIEINRALRSGGLVAAPITETLLIGAAYDAESREFEFLLKFNT